VTALAQYNSFDSAGWLDDLPPSTAANLRVVRGDVRDSHQMEKVCRGMEVVFHLASLIAIPYSYDAPSSYVQTNIQGTVNVLTAALHAGAKRVIHTSTSEVYGTARFTPITENHPLHGQSPYSASKIGADMIAESFVRSFGLPVTILRPFNTYGPRQSERAIIPTVIRQALDKNCETIQVGDLTPQRDFTFVDDTAEAFLAVATAESSPDNLVFNAGTGRMVTIAAVVDAIQSVLKCTKPVVQDAQRYRPGNSEVMALMADASRLTSATGWKPQAKLEDGISRTVEWWRERLLTVRPQTGYMV
jgi:UDP-glucose 4-epimerase